MFTSLVLALAPAAFADNGADHVPAPETVADYAADAESKQKRPLLAAGLNWFFPGAGYLYNGVKPAYVGLPMIAGAVGLTYVEQIHTFEGGGNLLETDPTAFGVMFGAVLALNTGVAIDAYREAKAINRGELATRERTRPLDLAFAPVAVPDERGTSYGLSLDGRF